MELARRRACRSPTHLAESPDEAEFLADHAGPFRRIWDFLGAWDERRPALRRRADPLREIASACSTSRRVLAHVNYCDDDELDLLAAGRASVVYCPRTHAYFGHPPHRWRDMLAAGVNVAVGTDSLASSPDLNLVDDLRLVRQIAPGRARAATSGQLVTTRAARALQMATTVGTHHAGQAGRPRRFPLPGGCDDPLEAVLREARAAVARVDRRPGRDARGENAYACRCEHAAFTPPVATSSPRPVPLVAAGLLGCDGCRTTQAAGDKRPGEVWIPAGEFSMGAIEGDPLARDDESPRHRVAVDGSGWTRRKSPTRSSASSSRRRSTSRRPRSKPDWEELKKQLPPGTPKPPDDVLVAGFDHVRAAAGPVPLDNVAAWWAFEPGANWRTRSGPRQHRSTARTTTPSCTSPRTTPSPTASGPASACRPKPSGSGPPAAGWPTRSTPGARRTSPRASPRPTRSKAASPTRTKPATASPASPR